MTEGKHPERVDVEALKREIKSEVKAELREDEEFRAELKSELREEIITERKAAPGKEYEGDVPHNPENVWVDNHPFGLWLMEARRDVDYAHERLDGVEDTIKEESESASCAVYNGVPEHELSWMERYYHDGRDGVNGKIRKRDTHAKVLLNGLPDWAFTDNMGTVILPTAGKLKRKMERAITDADDDRDSFEYAELYRACEVLESRTDGKIKYIEEHPKVGRHLRIPNPDDIAIPTDYISGPDVSDDGKQALLAAL